MFLIILILIYFCSISEFIAMEIYCGLLVKHYYQIYKKIKQMTEPIVLVPSFEQNQ